MTLSQKINARLGRVPTWPLYIVGLLVPFWYLYLGLTGGLGVEPIEALEQEYPLMIERYELVDDSGGPGRWRGGLGLLREVKVLESACDFSFSATRLKTAP